MEPAPNKRLRFKGIRIGEYKRGSKPGAALVIAFDGFEDWNFDFGTHYQGLRNLALKMRGLGRALDIVFEDAAAAFDWHDFVMKAKTHFQPATGTEIYVKLTEDKDRRTVLGELPCFSKNPDMEYSESDRTFLVPVTGDEIKISPNTEKP